jgi:hypothetical protein
MGLLLLFRPPMEGSCPHGPSPFFAASTPLLTSGRWGQRPSTDGFPRHAQPWRDRVLTVHFLFFAAPPPLLATGRWGQRPSTAGFLGTRTRCSGFVEMDILGLDAFAVMAVVFEAVHEGQPAGLDDVV